MTPQALARIQAAAMPAARAWSAAEYDALLSSPGSLLRHVPHAFTLGRVTLDEAEILMIATHPDYGRQGRASRSLAQWLDAARDGGARRAFLEVADDNHGALALYAANRFEEVGRRAAYYARQSARTADALVLARSL